MLLRRGRSVKFRVRGTDVGIRYVALAKHWRHGKRVYGLTAFPTRKVEYVNEIQISDIELEVLATMIPSCMAIVKNGHLGPIIIKNDNPELSFIKRWWHNIVWKCYEEMYEMYHNKLKVVWMDELFSYEVETKVVRRERKD